ncbi:MAG: hypothetical protein U5J95_10260 [Balneolaceae bacterium]|nr:hypothetical protein [Balneolaceae bacterium]
MVEIKKSSLSPILEKNPETMEELSERLADRQLVNEGFFEEIQEEKDVEEVRANYSKKFLRGMKNFFGL